MIIQIPYLLKNPEKPVAAADDELLSEASNDINKNFIFLSVSDFPLTETYAFGCAVVLR